ncbi:helix-turn-helix domain-containing protein [Aeromicrobium sp. Leaf291]|uniref:helix-turn-helix domain-containing protein n=1 Tax=Aeromicrobium sp. Leaf291 TaxID=1736325 RepID=UPI0006FFCAD2|nr:helix-turn-helix domain-containing protein [Aeromicrobium sp. Leaf291]KQP81550.1 hypothetical protein ASF35_16090 [Aeromicrobium sp. Leaf291]
MKFNIEVELAERDVSEAALDKLLDTFDGLHPAATTSARGWITVILTVEAPNLQVAVASALGLAPVPAVSVTGMTTREYDRRVDQEVPAMPELLSLTEAAERLGVSRQAVHQRIESGSLPAAKVGNGWAIAAAAVTPPARSRATAPA